MVRYVVGALALAPFVLLLLAMTTGRARVQPCCVATASPHATTPDASTRAAHTDRDRAGLAPGGPGSDGSLAHSRGDVPPNVG